MKLNTTPRINQRDPALELLLRESATQVNKLAEGRISANYTALTAAPGSGTWAQGDFVKNAEPTELGASSSKYVIHGWQCVSGGTPGTWVECRFLTGN